MSPVFSLHLVILTFVVIKIELDVVQPEFSRARNVSNVLFMLAPAPDLRSLRRQSITAY